MLLLSFIYWLSATQINTENQNNEVFDIHAKAVARFVHFFDPGEQMLFSM